ncbi:sensor histidine kinase [Leptothermofonsia sp. ETS-13]|uniref:sensor histidine kinase n=1 Tax=Leptothermofonsia sp. ETS-13 TaxID=3035696 RepID=UPI003BA141E1
MECDREADLINDLLDLQRLTSGTQSLNLEPIHLQEWVSQIADSFQERIRSRQQVLQVEISTELPVIMSDPTCLDRILTELLNNACKYTPPGERIKVSTKTIRNEAETEKLPKNGLSLLSSPLSFVLDVCNFGVEIPAGELPNIFEKFYRVPGIDRWKQGGTGLGLALVKKMTQHLGGKIYVASTANQTCFTIELPISPSIN